MSIKPSVRMALSLGLTCLFALPALAIPNRVERENTNSYRGTKDGQNGTWFNYVDRTYRYFEDPAKVAAQSALSAVIANPTDLQIQEFIDLKALAAGTLSDAALAAIVKKIADGTMTLEAARAQISELARLEGVNRNSNYPNNLPLAFLTSSGTLDDSIANQVGAWGWGSGVGLGNNVATKITNAYSAAGIDPVTKRINVGPLAGQTLSGNFTTMIDQLVQGGFTTLDWDYNTLIRDLGGASTIVRIADLRSASNGSKDQANLFVKDNLHDATLTHNYDAGLNGETASDDTVRGWISTYDGIGSFSNRSDIDFYQAMTFSSAAKLVAQAKALDALGLSTQAEAKRLAARNVILLTGNDHDPLVLDLNHNGKVDVTGLSSSKYRNKANKNFVEKGSVKFDLLANGRPIRTEWIANGDGFLVDNRKNVVLDRIASGKNLTGANLFGDIEGYPGGFMKLGSNFDKEAKFASDKKVRLSAGFGVLKGDEMKDLLIWTDNGDGVAQASELKSLAVLGITELSVRPQWVKGQNGETNEQSYFIQNGQKYLIQEVWFMGK